MTDMGQRRHTAEPNEDVRPLVWRSRRNNVLPGMLIVLGGVLLAYSAFRPWIEITGARVTAGFTDIVQVSLNPNVSQGADDDTRQILVGLAGGIIVLGLLLVATRTRGIGLLWRFLALVASVMPGVLFYYVWQAANSSPEDVLRDPNASFWEKTGALIADLPYHAGLLRIGPTRALYAALIGVLLVALGCFVPSRHIAEPRH